MAFQVNIPNEATWAKEIGSSQTGVIQGVLLVLKDHVVVDILCFGNWALVEDMFSSQSLRSTRTGADLARQSSRL